MQPTLVSGDLILATHFFKSFIKKNSLIVFYDNYHSYIIKRVAYRKESSVMLKSDNVNTNSIVCQNSVSLDNKIYTVLIKINFKYFIRGVRVRLNKFNLLKLFKIINFNA
ncbi:MAG: hypothetical protein CMH70_08285 [Nitrosomonadaceae bacterium]|nr:hypothetical protein [Nitrosomonadaceae bacterium]